MLAVVKMPLCLQYQKFCDLYVGWKENKGFESPMVQTVPAGAQPDLESMTFISAKTCAVPEVGAVQNELAALASTLPSREVWRAEARKILGLEEDKETC